MPQVILVRLVPMKPTDGVTFSGYLTNLSIRAFDLSFGNSADGTLVGQAQRRNRGRTTDMRLKRAGGESIRRAPGQCVARAGCGDESTQTTCRSTGDGPGGPDPRSATRCTS
jgi:hypothetical protein